MSMMFGRFPAWVVAVACLAVIASSFLLLSSFVRQGSSVSVGEEEVLRTPERSPAEVTDAYAGGLAQIEQKINESGSTCAEKKSDIQALVKELRVPKQTLQAHISAFFMIEKLDPNTESAACILKLKEAVAKITAAL